MYINQKKHEENLLDPECVRSKNESYTEVLDKINWMHIASKLMRRGYHHRWELPVLYYHKIMVIYPYPF